MASPETEVGKDVWDLAVFGHNGTLDFTGISQRWLREIDVGRWDGLTWDEARQHHPAEHLARERDVVGQPFPEGESFKDLQARVVPGFLHIAAESLAAGRRRVLVVGHKGVNRVILAHVLGLPLEDLFSIEQDFCAVTELLVSADAAEGLLDLPIWNASTPM
jgi:broad specificity phosphatase PhoE